MVKTRTWVIVIAAALLCSAVLAFVWGRRPAPGTTANIYQNGVCIYSVDLSAVTEEQRFTVTGENGSNEILVEPGRICVWAADCPDQVCVKAGWLSDSASPVICLPHRLVIRLEKEPGQSGPDIDAVTK